MAGMDECSVDSIVTDPPYGLSFMGKGWDRGVPGVEFWVEALRVAKPGAHLLAFGGTRMVHRLAVAIEDAGWEIRDRIHWVYGSGFPKSHNVSKAIDKAAGAEREVVGFQPRGRSVNTSFMSGGNNITAPATPEAQQWDGWGTALKPAVEPIILARKPFKGTVAANVLEWGTGAINVDGCRVGDDVRHNPSCMNSGGTATPVLTQGRETQGRETQGRFPANLIHDGSDEVVGLFPHTHGHGSKTHSGSDKGMFDWGTAHRAQTGGDSGSAARFFYCAKASKRDRDEGLDTEPVAAGGMSGRRDGSMGKVTYSKNHHPTVKPTDLMAYLCRLITPPGGTILDPFNGSGSTGKAAVREGFNYIGCELDPEYVEIARARIAAGVPA